MYGVLGEAPVLAVLVAIMVMIQHEMVAHSWTVITKNTMEHSRAAHADGQGWSAIGSSGQPLRAAGLYRTFMGAIFDKAKGATRSERDLGFSS